MRALGGVKPEIPVVVLGGSALYRVAENRYEVLETLPPAEVPRLLALFSRHGIPLLCLYGDKRHAARVLWRGASVCLQGLL